LLVSLVLAQVENSDGVPGWVRSGAIGLSVAIGLLIYQRRQQKKNANLWQQIEPILQKGPATLHEISDSVGMSGFYARGKVALALQEMSAQGKVETIPAPDGTPQLEKVKYIKYRLAPHAA
jgi:hypothetical protein